MPRVVDHEQRRRELGLAMWRVIRRDGLEHASVRAVAAEAGWSAGSLRYYFATQSELLAFAMRLVVERVEARIDALERDSDPRRAVEQVLHELLPLDDERHTEAQVWLAFSARALVDPHLRTEYNEVHDALRQACASAVQTLAAGGRVDPGVATTLQAERLHTLIDGLAMHAALRPDLTSPERIISVVGVHLDALEHEPGPAGATPGS